MTHGRENNIFDLDEHDLKNINQIRYFHDKKPYDNLSGFKLIYRLAGRKRSSIGIITYSLIWVIIFSLITIIERKFLLSGESIGFGEDYVWYAVIIGFIFLFILMNRLYQKFFMVFSDKIITLINWKNLHPSQYLDSLRKNINIIDIKSPFSKILFAFFWILSFLGLIFYGVYMQTNSQAGINVWHHSIHPLGYVSWLIYTAIIFLYIGPILVWRYLSIIYASNNLLKLISKEKKDYLIIYPMSPDRAGGLSLVGRLAVHISQISLIPLIAFSIWFFVRDINLITIVTLPLLVFMVIISFISLLYRTHDVMVKSKDKELNIISNEMNNYYHLIKQKIKAKGVSFDDEAKNAMNSLEKLQLLYQNCERMVTWPINIRILSEFLTGLFIPIIIAIIPILYEKLYF